MNIIVIAAGIIATLSGVCATILGFLDGNVGFGTLALVSTLFTAGSIFADVLEKE